MNRILPKLTFDEIRSILTPEELTLFYAKEQLKAYLSLEEFHACFPDEKRNFDSLVNKNVKGNNKSINEIDIGLKELIHPAVLKIIKKRKKPTLHYVRNEPFPLNKPILFIVNHSNVHDAPMLLQAVGVPTFILGEEAGFRRSMNGLLMSLLNGMIWIIRESADSKKAAVNRTIQHLIKGNRVAMWPEATWNTTPNKPVEHFYLGPAKILQESGALGVNVAFQYDHLTDNCYAIIDKPFEIKLSENILEGIDYIEGSMVDLKFEIYDYLQREFPETSKKPKLNSADFFEYIEKIKNDAPWLDFDYESRFIRKPNLPINGEISEWLQNWINGEQLMIPPLEEIEDEVLRLKKSIKTN